jgi:hypothetical protein
MRILAVFLIYMIPWLTFGAGVYTLLVRSVFLGLLVMAYSFALFYIRRETLGGDK